MTNTMNQGHGHVFPRPDGVKARCGGPSVCNFCAIELGRKNAQESVAAAEQAPSKELAERLRALDFGVRMPPSVIEEAAEFLDSLTHEPPAALQSVQTMFRAAVFSLAEISQALDIPDHVASVANGNEEILKAIAHLKRAAQPPGVGPLKLDTERQVFFYEQDHYYLSNFSAFSLTWSGRKFDTSEAAYHWEKFGPAPEIGRAIELAPSAHEAFKLAERHKGLRRKDWDAVKVDIMRRILRAKAEQHEYVRRKLLETGDRELIENSWRDPYWGWGENRDGLNMLGKLWMEVRAELRASALTKCEGQS